VDFRKWLQIFALVFVMPVGMNAQSMVTQNRKIALVYVTNAHKNADLLQ
jgi:hypothetical protein